MTQKTPLEAAILSASSRNARYEQRRRQQGLKKLTVWVPADKAEDVKADAERLCEQHLSSRNETT